MPTKRYQAIEVRQQPIAPAMYMISAAARELLDWCDVPRTKENYMAGYQRVLTSTRVTDISAYLRESPNNTLPGAIIVAADAEDVSIQKEGAAVFIEVRDDTRDFKTKLEELFGGFTTRLSSEELSSADIEFSSENETEEYDDDSEYPISYLALLAKELQDALIAWENISPERREAIKDYINGVSKPGLIIDRQQVFQFYVLNSKAKPLSPTELRRIVSTSLTNFEIEDLYKRFRKTGLDAEEARWTYEMNTSPHSVFRGLINFGFSKPGEIIPENVADQLVRSFMKMPRKRYASLMDPVSERWNEPDERLRIFFDFWKAVKTVYADAWGEAVAAAKEQKEQKQIFKKVALITLQRFLLDRFTTALPYRSRAASPPFMDEETTKEMVISTLENLPSKFFMLEWKMKQMDTSAGREILYDEMSKAWGGQGRNIGHLKLFRS